MSELREHTPAAVSAGHASPSKASPKRANSSKTSPVAANANGQPTLSDRVRSLRLDSGRSAPRPRSAWLPWGLTVIALATAALFGWRAYVLGPTRADTANEPSAEAAQGKSQGASASASRPASNDSAAEVNPAGNAPAATGTAGGAGEVVLDSKGYVIAAHQIQISPQVGGEIIWLDPRFKEGAVYKKGEKLAEIDPVIFVAQLNSAKAALDVAKTNLVQVETGSSLKEIEAAKAQLKNLAEKLEMSRIDDRYNQASGVAISRHDKEKSAAQVRVDQAACDMQKETLDKLTISLDEQRKVNRAQVLSAQASVDQAAKQLKNCTITAPTNGIILTKKAELGGYVNPLAQAAAIYLCEMADLGDLEVELDIQERDISRVVPNQRCRIMPEAGQQDEAFLKTHPDGYLGYVSRRLPVANRSKGAITVRVKVEIPVSETSGEYLLPDMGVLVSFLKTGQTPAVAATPR